MLALTHLFGFGVGGTPTFADLTTGKTASSGGGDTVGPSGLIDDVIAISGSNYWQGDGGNGANHWASVDLASSYAVTRLRVWNDTGGAYVTGFRIDCSATGAWGGEEVAAYTGTMAQGTGTGAGDYQEFSWASVGAYRYWRLYVTGCNNGRLANPLVIELELSL